MEPSPFPYQGPLPPEEVSGRDELLATLVGQVTERQVTAVLGPRRFGKTSLLHRLATELNELDTIWVDLYEVTSMADLAARLDDALAATGGGLADKLGAVAASLQVNLGLLRVTLAQPRRRQPDPSVLLGQLLAVLVEAAVRHPTLLVIDEFSSIAGVPGATGALRTALQTHYRDLGIVFAGSHPSMMRTLFTDRPQPFYAQADLVEVGPLGREAVDRLIRGGFARSGRKAGRVPGLVHDLAEGHPQRTMQLADAVWRRTPPGGAADRSTWAEAVAAVRAAESDGMERLYSGLAQAERDVLRAVARSGSVYGREARLLDLAHGSASHARRVLLDRGELRRDDDRLVVVDPLLADWAVRRFPI